MSDPVTQVEIEDVLTSIRRLVSDNDRAPERDVEPVEHHVVEAPSDADDRLVLTPALRVAEMPQDAAENSNHDEDIADDSLGFLGNPAHNDVSESNDDAHEPAVETLDDFGDTEGEEVELEVAEVSGYSEDLQADHEIDALDDVHDDVSGEEISKPEADFSEKFDEDEGIALSDAQAFDSRIVHWGRLGAADEHPYEPDVPGDSDYAGTDVETLSWGPSEVSEDVTPLSLDGEMTDFEINPEKDSSEDEVAAIPEADEVEELHVADMEEGGWGDDGADKVGEDAAGAESTQASDVDDGEDVIPMFIPGGFRHTTQEPLESRFVDTDETQSAAEGFAGRIESEAREYVTDTLEDSIAPELDGMDPEDTAFLDEAMLRDLVGEIVRQELQGALGERITRNVRKLVRREIHRALAAHELE